MLQVLSLVMPLFSIIFLGWLCARLRPLPIEGLAWLNLFVIYIALPALFFRLIAATPVDEFANAGFILSTTLATLAIFVLSFVIALASGRADTRVATIQGFAGAYGNIGYLGPPLAIAAFGVEVGVPVALIFCLDNSMHFILAPTLMAIGKRRHARRALATGNVSEPEEFPGIARKADPPHESWASLIVGIARRIFLHPFILATMAGMVAAASGWQARGALDALLESLANAAAPCALFAMGVTAALRPLRRVPVELTWLIPIKLILHPLLMYLLVSRLPGVEPLWLHAAVLLAALPSATNVFVIAQQYGVWEERASSAVVLSTTASVISVTLLLYLIERGYLG